MEGLPKVSVVMITYKHEKFIERAIVGILGQSYLGDVELIIADDHSPDATALIVEKIAKTHKKGNTIKYTRHNHNMGMANNFIWALGQAKGEYIAICEGDDFWIDPRKIQLQIDFLEKNSRYYVSTHDVYIIQEDYNIKRLDENPRRTEPFLKSKAGDTYTLKDYIETEALFHTCSFVFRSDVVRSLPAFFKDVMSLDQALFIICCMKGSIHYINVPMACHLKHIGGVTNSAKHRNVLKSINNQLKMLNELNKYSNYQYSEIFNIRINRLKMNKLKVYSGLHFIKNYLFND